MTETKAKIEQAKRTETKANFNVNQTTPNNTKNTEVNAATNAKPLIHEPNTIRLSLKMEVEDDVRSESVYDRETQEIEWGEEDESQITQQTPSHQSDQTPITQTPSQQTSSETTQPLTNQQLSITPSFSACKIPGSSTPTPTPTTSTPTSAPTPMPTARFCLHLSFEDEEFVKASQTTAEGEHEEYKSDSEDQYESCTSKPKGEIKAECEGGKGGEEGMEGEYEDESGGSDAGADAEAEAEAKGECGDGGLALTLTYHVEESQSEWVGNSRFEEAGEDEEKKDEEYRARDFESHAQTSNTHTNLPNTLSLSLSQSQSNYTEYEIERQKRIKLNKQRLSFLGLSLENSPGSFAKKKSDSPRKKKVCFLY